MTVIGTKEQVDRNIQKIQRKIEWEKTGKICWSVFHIWKEIFAMLAVHRKRKKVTKISIMRYFDLEMHNKLDRSDNFAADL